MSIIHESGDILPNPNLKTLINTAANTCTSLLIDQYLKGKYRAWAVTAGFWRQSDNRCGNRRLSCCHYL